MNKQQYIIENMDLLDSIEKKAIANEKFSFIAVLNQFLFICFSFVLGAFVSISIYDIFVLFFNLNAFFNVLFIGILVGLGAFSVFTFVDLVRDFIFKRIKNNKVSDKLNKKILEHFYVELPLKNKKKSFNSFINSLEEKEIEMLEKVKFSKIRKERIIFFNDLLEYIEKEMNDENIKKYQKEILKIIKENINDSDTRKKRKNNIKNKILLQALNQQSKEVKFKNNVIQSI